MTTPIPLPGGYEISTDPARLDTDLVHRWMQDTYWAQDRTRDLHDRAVAGSLNFGVYEKSATGAQVGYARVVTDEATFAWLDDVYIAPAARGKGLAAALTIAVRDHLAARGVQRIVIAVSPDVRAFYTRLGFAPLVTPEKWLALGDR